MKKHYNKMRANMVSGNYEAAAKFVDSQKKGFYSKDNRLLYYMDRGMILHLGKKYKESNASLEKGKSAAEDLWTESVGKNAAAWVTTDNSLPYQGEDFEKVALHIVAALNYIGLQEFSGARVEARQVVNKLELYNSKYEEGENLYKDDAFARWMSGKMRGLERNNTAWNEAWIDYRKAIDVYEKDYAQRYGAAVPQFLIQDTLQTLEALGGPFQEEFQQMRARFPDVPYVSPADAKAQGEIVFIHLNGEAPHKIDKFWDATANNDPLRIAYPEFVAKVPRIVTARMRSSSGAAGRTELGQPWTAIAIQNLNDHMGRIKAKAIARAIAKYIAAKGVQAAGKNKGGKTGAALQLAGALFQAGSYVAEEADKRSWITLPASINIGRIYVPEGETDLDVEFVDARGAVVGKKNFKVGARAGETTFLIHRTYQ